jgi:hypothetical protein
VGTGAIEGCLDQEVAMETPDQTRLAIAVSTMAAAGYEIQFSELEAAGAAALRHERPPAPGVGRPGGRC